MPPRDVLIPGIKKAARLAPDRFIVRPSRDYRDLRVTDFRTYSVVFPLSRTLILTTYMPAEASMPEEVRPVHTTSVAVPLVFGRTALVQTVRPVTSVMSMVTFSVVAAPAGRTKA